MCQEKDGKSRTVRERKREVRNCCGVWNKERFYEDEEVNSVKRYRQKGDGGKRLGLN